jgi:hypothetical protein
LQSDPNVPPEFLDLAEPIALAMGALHRIERSEGPDIRTNADTALQHVRAALSKLQEKPASHPAISAAMEAVAGSLGLVHSLTKAAEGPVTATASIPKVDEPIPATAPLPQRAYDAAMAATVAAPVAVPAVAPVAVTAPPPVGYPPAAFAAHPPAHASYGAPLQQARQAPRPAEPEPSLIGTPGIDPSLPLINADLGAHSTTNFYKGLAGNDIIEHGGIFVSTYKSPALGTPIRLRISLPGGYEFEAQGIVRWRRENEGEGAPPGFGAQFTNIAPEAKHLIYRYVRNREPLFHDDL